MPVPRTSLPWEYIILFNPIWLTQWFPTLGNLGILGLQFPEAWPTNCAGQGFWELQSGNTWATQRREPLHCSLHSEGTHWLKIAVAGAVNQGNLYTCTHPCARHCRPCSQKNYALDNLLGHVLLVYCSPKELLRYLYQKKTFWGVGEIVVLLCCKSAVSNSLLSLQWNASIQKLNHLYCHVVSLCCLTRQHLGNVWSLKVYFPPPLWFISS